MPGAQARGERSTAKHACVAVFVMRLGLPNPCLPHLVRATLQVFSQALCALVSLAPSRYAKLFNALAASYASKTHQLERLPAHLTGQAEERTVVLSAFAAVAHGEPPGHVAQLLRHCLTQSQPPQLLG